MSFAGETQRILCSARGRWFQPRKLGWSSRETVLRTIQEDRTDWQSSRKILTPASAKIPRIMKTPSCDSPRKLGTEYKMSCQAYAKPEPEHPRQPASSIAWPRPQGLTSGQTTTVTKTINDSLTPLSNSDWIAIFALPPVASIGSQSRTCPRDQTEGNRDKG